MILVHTWRMVYLAGLQLLAVLLFPIWQPSIAAAAVAESAQSPVAVTRAPTPPPDAASATGNFNSLSDFPELQGLDSNTTEEAFYRMTAEKGLRYTISLDSSRKAYHVYRKDGENVIVMFSPDDSLKPEERKCLGAKRMERDPSQADRLFNGLGKDARSLELRLWVGKTVLKLGENPAMKVDVRNTGPEPVAVSLDGNNDWEIEMDGKWYGSEIGTTAWPAMVKAGEKVEGISVPPAWIPHALTYWFDCDGAELGPWRPGKKQLMLEPGRHIFRVGVYPVLADRGERGDEMPSVQVTPGKPVLAVSNAIEIEIQSAEVSRPAGAGEEAKGIPSLTPPFEFAITTVLADGAPQPGVRVRCIHPRPERATPLVDTAVRSDDKGVARFSLTRADLLADRYVWFSTEDENFLGDPSAAGLSPLDGEFKYTLRVLPAKRFEFIVRDEKGEPVPDAFIGVLSVGPTSGWPNEPDIRGHGEGRSDAAGRSVIFCVEGKAEIGAVAKGYAAVHVEGVTLVPDKPVAITLSSRGQDITGQVKDDAGNPLAGVQVTARAQYVPILAMEGFVLRAVTDSGGRFALRNASAAMWLMSATAEAPARPCFIESQQVYVGTAPVGPLQVVAKAGFRLKGKYVSKYNLGLRGGERPWIAAYVERPGTNDFETLVRSQMAADGSFELSGLPCEGSGGVDFMPMDGFHAFIKVPRGCPFEADGRHLRFKDVPPGAYEGIEVRFLRAGILSGAVVDALGKPVPRATASSWPGRTTKADKDGRFVLEVPPGDKFVIAISDAAGQRVLFKSQPLTFKEGEMREERFVVP